MSNKTTADKLMAEFLSKFNPPEPSPLMRAALNGNLDSYIARESLKYMPKDQETVTFSDIKNACNMVLGLKETTTKVSEQ